MKQGWIRFMDETPPIGEQIIVVYSSSPYNGKSFGILGRIIDNDCALLLYSGKPLTVPIYNTADFDSINGFVLAYAHHWAYDTEENRINLDLEQVCESARRYRGEKQPVDVSSATKV